MLSKYKKILLISLFALMFILLSSTTVYAVEKPIAVIGMSPQANITTETIVEFSSEGSIPSDGATIISTSWGGDFSITGQYPEGEHTVTLVVKDSNGMTSDPATITFLVTNAVTAEKPVAVITMTPSSNITDLTTVSFSSANSTTYNGQIIDQEWKNISSTYPAGYNTVSLRVKDALNVWSEWTELTFYVSQEGNITEPPTGVRYVHSIVENSGDSFKTIDETRQFDLSQLMFTVRYGDDTTKTVSALETTASMDYKYKDIAYLTADKQLIFYNDAEYEDYVNVNFTYSERNKTVKTYVTFKFKRSDNIGLIKRVTTNVTEVQIPKDEIFYLKDILFKVLYDNGYEENITGDKMEYYFSEEFKDLFFIDDTDYVNGIKITPTINGVPGKYGYVEFWLTTNSFYKDALDPNIPIETFKKYIKFTIVDSEDEYITENSIDYISCQDTVVGISDNEKLNINSLEFIAHLYNGQIRKLYATNFVMNLQYKYKQYLEIDEVNNTIMFKPDTPYGTEILLNFVYSRPTGTKYIDVKVVYVEGSPNHGSEITPLFTDISGHWAQNDIIQMSLKNMVVGYAGSFYYPDKNVTRAEVASFISKYLELDKKDVDIEISHFTDVLEYNHSYEDIEKVYMAGVFQGYENGTFLPDALITRQELATVLYRTYQYKTGLALSGNNTTQFLDHWVIADWAKDSVYSAKALGIIQGREDGKFHPLDNTTRAEITAILNRMLNK